VHDTPNTKMESTPLGLGMSCMTHAVPFHCSATIYEAAGLLATAMHAEADVHDTPSSPSVPPLGLGVCWMAQPVPFQLSASVPPEELPTAVHAEAEVHDTASRPLPPVPLGLAVFWIVQAAPFQRSASVTEVPVLVV
jgi:hypothetical protein